MHLLAIKARETLQHQRGLRYANGCLSGRIIWRRDEKLTNNTQETHYEHDSSGGF